MLWTADDVRVIVDILIASWLIKGIPVWLKYLTKKEPTDHD